MSNTIVLKGDRRYEEHIAGEGGIYPGMLLKLNSLGKVIKHDTEGGVAERLFAEEDALQGKTVDDVYTIANIVACILALPGSVVNVLVEAGQDVAIGQTMISAANGKMKAANDVDTSVGVVQTIGMMEEACDLSGVGAVDTLAAMRVI